MFSSIRKRLTYANVAMTLALVFAMSSGAYAASKYLITSTKQISPKVLKALVGKTGKTGSAGAQGAQGLKGEAGAAGASVTGKEGPEGKAGKDGKEGPQGPPGTTGFTKTLPSGESEKGDWSLLSSAQETFGAVSTGVSFDIPLVQAPGAVHVIPAPTEAEEQKGEFPKPPKGCTGNVTEPGAVGGNLCVFAREERNVNSSKICSPGSPTVGDTPLYCVASTIAEAPEAADPYGFDIIAGAKEKGIVGYDGTWAVTAE